MRLIDADALRDVYERYFHAIHVQIRSSIFGEGMRIAIKSCIELLDNATTESAVPVVHGQWSHRKGDGALYRCSECGEASIRRFKFCPECGADMRERSGE